MFIDQRETDGLSNKRNYAQTIKAFMPKLYAECTDTNCFWYVIQELPEDMDEALEMDLTAKFKKQTQAHLQTTGHQVIAEHQSERMTWKEFKAEIERLGLKDGDTIDYINCVCSPKLALVIDFRQKRSDPRVAIRNLC